MGTVAEKPPHTPSKLIAMAISLVGSADYVLAHMKCPESDFRDYRADLREPRWPEFDRLVELIIREQAKAIAKNRALLAEMRATRRFTSRRTY